VVDGGGLEDVSQSVIPSGYTDIIGAGASAPTFNMAFSLTGETIPGAGTPGQTDCHGETVSALAQQFGGIRTAASALGFDSDSALQDGLRSFCGQ
jgi:hypothetical protein